MIEREARYAAVERAYRAHADDLYRVAFAILRDADAASDATHAAFARAFERWGQYDPGRPLLPWLHAIVAHEALDAIRRSRVRRIAVATIAERDIASRGAPGPDLATRVTERAAIAGLRSGALRHRDDGSPDECGRVRSTLRVQGLSRLWLAQACPRGQHAEVPGVPAV
jgi:RNA polymerase sigma factor (sigma-70 family)